MGNAMLGQTITDLEKFLFRFDANQHGVIRAIRFGCEVQAALHTGMGNLHELLGDWQVIPDKQVDPASFLCVHHERHHTRPSRESTMDFWGRRLFLGRRFKSLW